MRTIIKQLVLLFVITSIIIPPAVSHELLINPSAAGNDDKKGIGYTLYSANNISLLSNCEIIFFDDFESGWGNWLTSSGVWEIGVPITGPEGAWSGRQCAGTVLSENYPRETDSDLISPTIDLPTVRGDRRIILRFWQSYVYGSGDRAEVYLRSWNGSGWEWSELLATPAYQNTSSSWSPVTVDLTLYAGQRIQLALYHIANGDSSVGSGWYIDDVQICQGEPLFENPESFEVDWRDWSTDNGVWEIGIPTAGPEGAHTGRKCAGTVLSGDYPRETDSDLVSPIIKLPSVSNEERIEVRFWEWYSYGSGDRAEVYLKIWNGTTWTWSDQLATPAYQNTSSNWSPVSIDLTDYAGQRVQLAFYHIANGDSSVGSGWYIDDVEIWHGVPAFYNPDNFEVDWGDWSTDNGVWEVGVPPSVVGPSPVSGGQCVGTVLNENYPRETDSTLISPIITLPTVRGGDSVLLRFWQWYSYGSGDKAEVYLKIWDDSSWTWTSPLATAAWPNTSSDWSLVGVDLTAYTGQQVQLAFYHIANGDSSLGLGWYIDDVEISPWEESFELIRWSLADDTGLITDDKITCDMTPEFAFEFNRGVYGSNEDIQILDPAGSVIVPDSISGWETNTVVAAFFTPLSLDGEYSITLKSTINDGQEHYLNKGENEILFFTLDTTPPAQNVDDLVSASLGSVQQNADAGQTSARITTTNISSTTINGPMWLTLKTIGDPEIALLGSHGIMDDGYEYIDITGLLNDGQLEPGESVAKRLFFTNPDRKPFILSCEVLAQDFLPETQ